MHDFMSQDIWCNNPAQYVPKTRACKNGGMAVLYIIGVIFPRLKILHLSSTTTACWNSCERTTSVHLSRSYDVMCSVHCFVWVCFVFFLSKANLLEHFPRGRVFSLDTYTSTTIKTHQSNRLCSYCFPASHPKLSAECRFGEFSGGTRGR